jgi:hypothetical protein
MNDISLDEAIDTFYSNPTDKTAAMLATVTRQYNEDDMISDNEATELLDKVNSFFETDWETVEP